MPQELASEEDAEAKSEDDKTTSSTDVLSSVLCRIFTFRIGNFGVSGPFAPKRSAADSIEQSKPCFSGKTSLFSRRTRKYAARTTSTSEVTAAEQ